jgi:ZIP family zinc transporter
MSDMNPILLALQGTGFTFFMTALGASLVFFFRREMSADVRRILLGFAAGVMIAASVWSLLIPAIDMAEEQGKIGWIPAAGGFVLGGLFLLLLDHLLPHLHMDSRQPEGLRSSLKRTTLLVLAVTLHNIPEGLAVGLTFGLAAQGGSTVTIASAVVLAVGIGLQNFPEGAAISLPLRQEGLSRSKAFLYGAASGVVEPVAGVLGVVLAGSITGIMPWLLAMAAGAMIFVVVEELVPEACLGEHSHKGTGGVMVGFLIMMILDVALA